MTTNPTRTFAGVLLNAVYFSLSMGSSVWLFANYSSLSLISIPMAALAVFYVIAGFCAMCCLCKPNFLAGSSAFVLSGTTQKLIRSVALVLPLPALIYSANFAACVLTYDLNAAANLRVAHFSQFERALFGKSIVWNYITTEQVASTPPYRNVDFGPYIERLNLQIKEHWSPPKANETNQIVVQFKVYSDGRLANLCVVNSSGIEDADKAALKAIEDSAPFEHLPAGAPSDVDIQYTLSYTVSQDSESSDDDADRIDNLSASAQ